MVQVPPIQFAQFTPGFPVDGEAAIEALLTLAVRAVTAEEPIELELDVAAWDVGTRKTRSAAETASPINRRTDRRMASHLLEGHLVEDERQRWR
jgi:hypothetical protein